MLFMNDLARAVAGDARRSALTILCIVASVGSGAAQWERSQQPVPILKVQVGRDPHPPAEHYALPITAPLDQGDTDLCWVFATLSMLETNYMVRHPGSRIELSRAAVQFDAISDRLHRVARGQTVALEEGGLAVEALDLARRGGLIDRSDYHDVVDSDPVFQSAREAIERNASPENKESAVDRELSTALGAKPDATHLDGQRVSPKRLAEAVLRGESWTEFDLAGANDNGWGPSHDPDALPDTRVRYVRLDAMIDLIHQSLRRGEAVVWGTTDHALLIYGADYDRDGRPLSYLIKDSLPPYIYRANAEAIHAKLHDVTVAGLDHEEVSSRQDPSQSSPIP
jgi:hypothetical protein